MRRLIAGLAAAGLLAAAPASAEERSTNTPGAFDFYVLSLSWSPSYCRDKGGERDAEQCRSGRPFGFIVHGLWPQFEQGYPANCIAKPPRVDDTLIRGMLDITPSFKLVIHEWRKHGTCSGLTPEAYFDTVRRAFAKVSIPAEFRNADRPRQMAAVEVENAFVRENPGLSRDMVAVDCGGNILREVRVCLDRDLAFRPCAEVDRRACRSGRIEVPPVGGH